MNVYARLLRYLKPHRGVFGLGLVALLIFAILDVFSFTLLIPFLAVLFGASQGTGLGPEIFGGGGISNILSWSVGWLLAGAEPMTALRNLVLFLFAVFFVKNLAGYVYAVTASLVEGRVTRDIRNDTYAHLVRLDLGFFQRTRAGQVISRSTHDVDQVRMLVTVSLSKLVSSVLQAAAALVALLLISWKLTLVAALVLPPLLAVWSRLKGRLRRGLLRVLDAVGEVASQIQETVSGIRLVKASGAEEWEERRFRALTRNQYREFVRVSRYRELLPPLTEMITAAGIMGLLWYGTYLVLDQDALTAGAFLASLTLAGRLMSPMKFITQFPAQVQPGLAAAERVFELLDAPLEIVDAPGARPISSFRDSVRFEAVRFEYTPGVPVLEDIDLEIRPGDVIALVGQSGAGKSTLADLVPRFRDPAAGRITLDGVDLRELRLRDLRTLTGMVTQETILLHDTVRANIAYGLDGVAQRDLEAAARAANAHDFIVALPHGYDTVLGEKGTRLSGGQRQRVAIARALLRNPPILILDEATSSLDSESERLVQQAIEKLMRDRTVLVIAHRLSTIRRADQIIVLEAGRIVERGTHAELLELRGRYHRLHHMQFSESDVLLA
jgi:ATP-binding cassette, subfamily B, bacterial MsbA